MRYYIATNLSQAHMHKRLRAVLDDLGHTLTYDWPIHGSVQNSGNEKKAEIANAEAVGVLTADVLIALLPGGNGTHTEIGMAIGAGVPVILVGHMLRDGYECIFYHHEGVYWAWPKEVKDEDWEQIEALILFAMEQLVDRSPELGAGESNAP